jgi:hypothetical protein
VGESGILPAGEFLRAARELYGARAYHYFPTLAWWSAGDGFLSFLCWGGAALAILLAVGLAPRLLLLLLWVFYLSLTVVGQVFLNFQWDALLLETGFLAILYAPPGVRPRLVAETRPSTAARLLLCFLLFRLMFLSGITKIVSGDPTWAAWTALDYHFETQPLPTWTAWYAHHAPAWLHTKSVGAMLFVEMVVPFSIFAPDRTRVVRLSAFWALVLFQLAIAATGNYGFFNLVAVVLCTTLLDDRALRSVVPARVSAIAAAAGRPAEGRVRCGVLNVAAVALAILSTIAFAREIAATRRAAERPFGTSGLSDHVLSWVAPFRSINGYGLFRVMTTERPEIIVEVSRDGVAWEEVDFRWKPGDLRARPRLVAPHMPRLDWQMWFAALNPGASREWLLPFLRRLLLGSPEVAALLARDPFPEGRPRFVRLAYYRYRFSTREARRTTGAWWSREFVAYLTPPLALDEEDHLRSQGDTSGRSRQGL